MRGKRTVGIVGIALCVLAWNGSLARLEAQPAYLVDTSVTTPSFNGTQWVEMGGQLYFTGWTSGPGWGIYRTDGTPGAPALVKSVIAESLTVMNGAIYFAGDGAEGVELWKSDGTTAGTGLLLDIRPGANDSDPSQLTVVNNTLYFRANNGTNGAELWKSDGTAAGTVMVKDLHPGLPNGFASEFIDVGGTLFFASYCSPGCGLTQALWKTDGTSAGTVRVGTTAVTDVHELVNVNGTIFFFTNTGGNGYELWKSDGTTPGTVAVKDILPGTGSSFPHNLTAFGTLLLFAATDGVNGEELWRSDGTAGGTNMVQAIVPGNNAYDTGPFQIVNVGGAIYFVVDDGTHGKELWTTNGATATLVKDINPGTGSSLGYFNLNPNLWRPGLYAHSCDFEARDSRCRVITAVGGEVYFFAHDATSGTELWKTDGTEVGTVRVQEIYPGPGSSGVAGMGIHRAGDRMYLALRGPNSPTGDFSTELWAIPTAPAFVIVDQSVVEGTGGGASRSVTVHVVPPSSQTVTVDYATADGSAATPGDYTATSGTLTFGPGVPSQTFSFDVVTDSVPELNETLSVNLSNPSLIPIATPSAAVTILNDDGPAIFVDDVTVTEGTDVVFTVTLAAPSANTVTVRYETRPGTAGASDYTDDQGTVTFAPGDTSETVIISTTDDPNDEPDQTFDLVLSQPTYAVLGDGVGQATLLDNDGPPNITVNDIYVFEGEAGQTGPLTFTVIVSPASDFPVTVDYGTADNTALETIDYNPLSGTLNFAPGEVAKDIVVTILGDEVDEDNEHFFLNLSNPTMGTILDGQGVGEIRDNDTAAILIFNVAVTEGNSGTTNAALAVTLVAPSTKTITVDYTTVNQSATQPADYTLTSGTVTFLPGETTKFINVPVVGDMVDEVNELFHVVLSNPVNATINDGTGVVTINDDDPLPALSVDDVTVVEGNTGTVNAVFTVTLSPASELTVRVNRATANQTAMAPGDYTALSSVQLVFAPGETTKTVTVVVNGDTLDEANETFLLNLSGAINGTIADAQGVGTITDDEAPELSVNNVTVTEGNTGTINATFAVTLSSTAAGLVTVDYATADVTATAGADYTQTTGTLSFPAGTTSLNVSVPVIGDLLDEATETFHLNLTNPNGAIIADGQGVGTINDNDTAGLAINNVTVTEGNTGTVNAVFNVTMNVATGSTVTVNWATADQTATAGVDYVAASGSLTFNPGETLKTVTVTVNADTLNEVNESFVVNLSGAVGAPITDPQGLGTIADDDPLPTLSVNDVSLPEGDSSTSDADFTVTLSAPSGRTVIVTRSTANGTATAGVDYAALSPAVLTFAPGETTKLVTVIVNGDTTAELDETFVLNLSTPNGASLADGQGQGTIVNDDPTQFYTVTPCRLVDTRNPNGPTGGPALIANQSRSFPITGGTCGVPATARAVAINLAVVNPPANGNLRLYPAGSPLPLVSALNFRQGRTRGNNAVAALAQSGQLAVRCDMASGSTHFVMDVFGYFE